MNADSNNQETILTGEMNLFVDETVESLVQGQIDVFESQYKAKIHLTAKTESEIVNDLLSGKTNMAVLTRRLTQEEENYFHNKNVIPRISHFASDAVVFIRNKKSKMLEMFTVLLIKTSRLESRDYEKMDSNNDIYFS